MEARTAHVRSAIPPMAVAWLASRVKMAAIAAVATTPTSAVPTRRSGSSKPRAIGEFGRASCAPWKVETVQMAAALND